MHTLHSGLGHPNPWDPVHLPVLQCNYCAILTFLKKSPISNSFCWPSRSVLTSAYVSLMMARNMLSRMKKTKKIYDDDDDDDVQQRTTTTTTYDDVRRWRRTTTTHDDARRRRTTTYDGLLLQNEEDEEDVEAEECRAQHAVCLLQSGEVEIAEDQAEQSETAQAKFDDISTYHIHIYTQAFFRPFSRWFWISQLPMWLGFSPIISRICIHSGQVQTSHIILETAASSLPRTTLQSCSVNIRRDTAFYPTHIIYYPFIHLSLPSKCTDHLILPSYVSYLFCFFDRHV